MTTTPRDPASRVEGVALVVILLAVGGMAAAASFRHVHDWTMHNAPSGTGDWFGWANAVISDLVPLGVGLEVRRRRRHGLPVGRYPIIVILCAAALSLAGQLAEAKPSPSGWLLAAIPALGFLALTKLVLSRPTTTPTTANTAAVVPTPARTDTTDTVTTPTNHDGPSTTEHLSRQAAVPAELLPGARVIAGSHRRATGQPITPVLLAERMNVPADTAGRILAVLGETADPSAITTVHNGHPYPGAGR
jgi:hypothetical protein